MTAAKTAPAPRLRVWSAARPSTLSPRPRKRHDTPRVATPPRRRIERPPQEDERRDVADAEQGQQREQHRDGRAHAQAGEEGGPGRGDAHVHGQEVGEQPRQQALHRETQGRARRGFPARPMAAASVR